MDQITDQQQLVDELAAQCKPGAEQLIGLEHEKFVFTYHDRKPLPYWGAQGIQSLLTEMQSLGWQPSYEMENLTGLKLEDAAITLEPAGQLELSGTPWPDLHGVHREMLEHRRELSVLTEDLGLGVMALGFAPDWGRKSMDWMPKSRYLIMREYMPMVGLHGRDMMTRCCSVQLNLDYSSEADMAKKYRVAMALQPLVMLALANSPFADGRDSGLTSYRNYVWLHTDSARSGILPLVFSEDLSFAGYVQRALETPMYSVERRGAHVDLTGRYFEDLMQGTLSELPGEKPDLKDWHDHLNTLMYDVRLKEHLELRGNDSLNLEQSMALAAYWTGILYDPQALEKALGLTEILQVPALNQLRHFLPQLGLAEGHRVSVEHIYRADSLLEALEYTLELAEGGLKRRARRDSEGRDESSYLKPLKDIVARRMSPAEDWRRRYRDDWQSGMDLIYSQASF